MPVSTHVPNVPQIEIDNTTDPGLRDVIERAKVTKSPPPAWYRTMGNNPEVAKVLKSNKNDHLQELEEILGRTVIVKSDPLLLQEKFDLA